MLQAFDPQTRYFLAQAFGKRVPALGILPCPRPAGGTNDHSGDIVVIYIFAVIVDCRWVGGNLAYGQRSKAKEWLSNSPSLPGIPSLDTFARVSAVDPVFSWWLQVESINF